MIRPLAILALAGALAACGGGESADPCADIAAIDADIGNGIGTDLDDISDRLAAIETDNAGVADYLRDAREYADAGDLTNTVFMVSMAGTRCEREVDE